MTQDAHRKRFRRHENGKRGVRRVDAERQQQRVEADLGHPCRGETVPLLAVRHSDDVESVGEPATQLQRQHARGRTAEGGGPCADTPTLPISGDHGAQMSMCRRKCARRRRPQGTQSRDSALAIEREAGGRSTTDPLVDVRRRPEAVGPGDRRVQGQQLAYAPRRSNLPGRPGQHAGARVRQMAQHLVRGQRSPAPRRGGREPLQAAHEAVEHARISDRLHEAPPISAVLTETSARRPRNTPGRSAPNVTTASSPRPTTDPSQAAAGASRP